MKKSIFFIMVTILLVSCSKASNEEVSSRLVNDKQQVKLSDLEEISKVCLEGNIDDCNEIFKKRGELLPEFERNMIDNYLWFYVILASEQSAELKENIMKEHINYLTNKGYDILIKNNTEKNNVYYTKLLSTKIEPLTKLYKSGKIEIGMSENDLIISMGFPNKINKTTTANSVSQQWIYNESNIYVYLEKGKVTAFQN